MRRRTAYGIHATVALMTLSGVTLTWILWSAVAADAGWDAPVDQAADPTAALDAPWPETFGNPWQSTATTVHVLAGPALLFLIGLVWTPHVWARIRSGSRARRRTGCFLAALVPGLAVSGYLLQVLVAENLRNWTGWMHAGLGVTFAAFYAIHQLRPRRPPAETPG